MSPRTKCFPCFSNDSCSYFQCHADISHQAVNEIITLITKEEEVTSKSLEDNVSLFQLTGLDVYKTVIKENIMFHDSLLNNNPTTKDIFRQFFKITWLFMFKNMELSTDFPELTKNSHNDLYESLNGLKYLYELSEFGKTYSKQILEDLSSSEPDLKKIRAHSEKLDEIDSLQLSVGTQYPYLLPIVNYFHVLKGQLEGEDIVRLSESSFILFNDYANAIRLNYDLIEKTITEYKTRNNFSKNETPRVTND